MQEATAVAGSETVAPGIHRAGGPAGPSPAGVPLWFERAALAVLGLVAGGGLAGLVLAITGVFTEVTVALAALPAGLVAAALGAWLPAPVTTSPITTSVGTTRRPAFATRPALGARRLPSASRVTVAVLVGVVAVTAWHAAHHGEHLLTDRDPGVYVSTARWLARDGDLRVETGGGLGVEARDAVAHDSAMGFFADGTDPEDAPELAPQFLHFLPVVMAAASFVGGTASMLAVPAVLGGLGVLFVYVLAARWLPAPGAALAAAIVALAAPQLYVSRDAFSETALQLGALGALAALGLAFDRDHRGAAVIAGLAAGAAVAARVDAVILLAPVAPWLALQWRAGPRHRPVIVAFAVTAALAGAVGFVDLWFRSRPYFELHRSEMLTQFAVFALGLGAAMVVLVGPAVPRLPLGTFARRRLAAVTAVLIVAGVAFAWLVRPNLETTTESASGSISLLQELEGRASEPARRYYEDSVRWLGWYLGPQGVVAATVGIAGAACALLVARRRDRMLGIALAVFALPTLAYLWRARATPDHLWVMRRFVPVTIPGLAIAAAAVVVWIWHQGRTSPRYAGRLHSGRPVAAVLAIGLLAGAVDATWPLRDAREDAGAVDAIETVCDVGGDDAAYLVLAGPFRYDQLLPQTLRSWCDAPAVAARAGTDAATVQALALAWAERGRRLVVVGSEAAAVQALTGAPTIDTDFGQAGEIAQTLTRPPRRLVTQPFPLSASLAG